GEHIVYVHKVVREFVVSFCEQINEHVQVMNAVEHDCLVTRKFILSFQKFIWHLGVVHAGTKVMDDVISIVPANLVVACVNAVDGVRVKIVGVLPVYERMLCPVSKHHHQTGEDQRNDEDNERCLQVHKAHSNAEGDVNVFSDCESRVQFLALAIVQVEDRILYSYKHELEKVSYEMKSAVALITHCAAG